MMDTALVTFSAVKSGVDELADDIQRFIRSDIACRQTEHVRIKEPACVLCHTWLPANSGTDMRMGVSGHTHTVTREAEADTQITFAFLHSGSHRVGEIGEVTVLHRVTAEINHLGAFALQEQLNHGFQTKTCVVTCQRNSQFV